MKVLFYSEHCKFSKEIIKQMKENNFDKEFKMINIDSNPVPSQIKVVPTLIDPNYKNLLVGKEAFEYLFNKKYFNIKTNNIHLWKDKCIPNPEIKEDKLAKNLNDIPNEIISEQKNNQKVILSKKNLLLLKGRRF